MGAAVTAMIKAQVADAQATNETAETPEAPMLRGQAAGAAATTSAGSCSASDAAAMARLGSAFPETVAGCGNDAYYWFSFHKNSMASSVGKKAGLSSSCSSCFATAGQYGYDHCKIQCLFGKWCSELCLGCTSREDLSTQRCVGAGVTVPKPTRC